MIHILDGAETHAYLGRSPTSRNDVELTHRIPENFMCTVKPCGTSMFPSGTV